MFELTETLDLQAILAKSLQDAHGSETEVTSPRVLGQERDGSVLYTWNGPSPYNRTSELVTHVGLYDPASHANKILWSNDSCIHIITSSVNPDRTLMAYTTYDEGNDRQKSVYRAYLAEIFPQKRVFSLNIERAHYLRAQFLYGGSEAKPEKVAHMLLFLHKESIGLYRIPLARVERGIIMSDQPVTEQLVKRFVWCQWESLHQRLYFIVGRRVSRHEATPPGATSATRPVLSCLQFSQNAKYEHMLDLPLNMSFPNIKPNSRSTYLSLPFSQGIPDRAMNLSVLSLSNGTLCVCHQLPLTPTAEEMEDADEVDLEYTVTLPHHARELQGSVSGIPLSVAKTACLSFTWINEYLLVFLPGHFVHALNVSIEFEPCHHILLHRKTWESCLQEDLYDRQGEVTHQTQSKEVVPSEDHTIVKTPVVTDTCNLSLQDNGSVTDQTFEKRPVSVSEATLLKTAIGEEEPAPEQLTGRTLDETVKKELYEDCDETVEKTPVSHVGFAGAQRLPNKLNIVDSDSEPLGHLCNFITKQSNNSSTYGLFDCGGGKCYQLGVNSDSLVFLFSTCHLASTRQAVLHYVIRQGREISLLKQLFEMVAYDCASPEVPVLMEEFLVGLTYMNLRRQVERDVFQLLPFTTCQTFRGLFEKIDSGQRLSRVSYVSLQSMNIGTKSIRDRQQRRLAEDLWDNLCLHLRSRQLDQPNRFSQDRVQAEYRDLIRSIEKGMSPSSQAQNQKDSFLGRFSARARQSLSLPPASPRGRSDTVLGLLPPFLAEGVLHPQQDNLLNLTERLFAAHLGKYLRKDSKIKVANVAKEYISCQMQQSKQLCHMLWSIRGPGGREDYIPLSQRASDREYDLFQLLERFYMAVQELAYPVPPGFHTYFTVMGFRALSLSLFLQYVDRGVLLLTGEFIAQIMEDLSNDDADAQIKLQIISRLPRPLAEECFQQWAHPIAYRHTAIQQVSALLRDVDQREGQQGHRKFTHGQSHSAVLRLDEDEDDYDSPFHPLDTLIELMHHRDIEGDRGGSMRPLDPQFIRDVATFHTSHDLSTINF